MAAGGESSSATPILVEAAAKAALGALSNKSDSVSQGMAPPEARVCQREAARAGAAVSKDSASTGRGRQRGRTKLTEPSSAAPSRSWRVAVTLEPQTPVAVKVKGRGDGRPGGGEHAVGFGAARGGDAAAGEEGGDEIGGC